jgi:serine/threonine protein phosphatase PrpC
MPEYLSNFDHVSCVKKMMPRQSSMFKRRCRLQPFTASFMMKVPMSSGAEERMAMGVTCPACGGVSHDPEFCDHCNADLVQPAALFPPDRCPLFADQAVDLTPTQVGTLLRPEAFVQLRAREQSWRVHWISRAAWPRWRPVLEERLSHTVPALPPCRSVEEQGGFWVIAECAARRATPWERRSDNPIQEVNEACRFLEKLGGGLEQLHECGLVWLTFDPLELEEITSGEDGDTRLRFTNLDLRVFRAQRGPERLEARPAFAAPEVTRFHARDLGPATDVYHLALFAYYWLAGLLPQGFQGAGLEAFKHQLPPLRVYAPDLPPGIVAVLNRGLALEPRQRFSSPSAFVTAFQSAGARAESRKASAAAVHWEIGTHSRNGRAKAARGRDNEDSVLVRTFANPRRNLVAVADGITTCDVGSGALASLMTCMLLERAFDDHSHEDSFPDKITKLCREGSAALLNWAVAKGYGDQLASGRDLMGSTLLAGWLEGNMLTLANVGDSRAYLIDGATVEQMTVDGDLGSELLASGMPPEEVKGLGLMARGLRDCVGGCSVGDNGDVTILDDYCRPKLSRWRLLPGDIVVVCSDGLVEEDIFLEPEKLGEIVRSHPHLSAEALAEQLAEAADALQRPPSSFEPDGFGDNITCIVIRVRSP